MVRLLLIVEMANPGYVRRVAILLGPFNRLMLSLEGAKRMIRVVFNDIIVNVASFGSALGSCLDINDCHVLPPYY
jgi:hypothetical protein